MKSLLEEAKEAYEKYERQRQEWEKNMLDTARAEAIKKLESVIGDREFIILKEEYSLFIFDVDSVKLAVKRGGDDSDRWFIHLVKKCKRCGEEYIDRYGSINNLADLYKEYQKKDAELCPECKAGLRKSERALEKDSFLEYHLTEILTFLGFEPSN